MIACKRILCLISTIAVLGSGIPGAWAGDAREPADLPSAAACIEKYVAACGGSGLAKIETETWKGTLVRGIFGKVPFECKTKAPGRWRWNQTFAWGDQISYGFDGAVAWVQDTDGVGPMSPGQLADLRLILDAQAPLRMRDLFPEMAVTGSQKIGVAEAIVILAKSRDGTSIELAFDRETGFLLRAGDILFEDYRTIGEVKRPHRIILGRDEGESHLKMTMEVADIRQNLDIEDSIFARPACALPRKDPPLYRPRKEVEVGSEAMDACVGTYQHPEIAAVVFTVTREKNHLMIERTGWGQKVEIRPQSETDYFIEFLGLDFHFVKNAAGEVKHCEFGDRALKARKIP